MKGKGTIFTLAFVGIGLHWLSSPSPHNFPASNVQQVQPAHSAEQPTAAPPIEPNAPQVTPLQPLVQEEQSATKKVSAKDRAAIIKSIIVESINEYPGPCACPYNRARNGSACGKRSAYSKPGGYEPICYAGDVTEDMVQEWVASH